MTMAPAGVARLTSAATGVLLTPAALLALGQSRLVGTGSGQGGWGTAAVLWLLLGLLLLVLVGLSGVLSSLGPGLGGLLWGVVPGILVLQEPARGSDVFGLAPGGWGWFVRAAQSHLLAHPLLLGVLLCAVGVAASAGRIPPLPRRGRAGAALQLLWSVLSLLTVAAGLVAYGWGLGRLQSAWQGQGGADPGYPPGAELGPPLFWLALGLVLVAVVVAMGGRWWVAPLVTGTPLVGLGAWVLREPGSFDRVWGLLPAVLQPTGASVPLGDPVLLTGAGVLIVCAGIVGYRWGRVLRGAGGVR